MPHGSNVMNHQRKIDTVRNKDGKMLTNEKEMRQRWKEHFAEVLNRPHPEQVADVLPEVKTIEKIPLGPITKAEIRSAIISMRAGKVPGVDDITTELLKADLTSTVNVLHDIFRTVRLSQRTGVTNLLLDWQRRVT